MRKFVTVIAALSFCFYLLNCGSGDAQPQKGAEGDSTTVQDSSKINNLNKSEKKGKNKRGRPGKKNRDEDTDESADDQINTIPVEITELTTGDISSYLLYSSTLETEQLVDVYAKIGGLVEDIFVEESDRVKANQKLLQIENDEYLLDEQNAKLEYEKQQSNFKRFVALQKEELLSKDEFESARLSKEQARIAWERARLKLAYTTVRSPISGIIGERNVRIGERIQSTVKLFSVANLDEKIVRAYIPQKEFANIYKGQKAILISDVFPGQKFGGYVKRKSPIIDPQSGTFKVTIAVKDRYNKLSPGMFVNTELIVDTHRDTRLIPKAALIYENEKTYFFYVESDSVLRVEIKKGFEDSEKVEALNDIRVRTKIVVLGQNGLKDGSKIKIIKEKKYPWQQETLETLSAQKGLKRKD